MSKRKEVNAADTIPSAKKVATDTQKQCGLLFSGQGTFFLHDDKITTDHYMEAQMIGDTLTVLGYARNTTSNHAVTSLGNLIVRGFAGFSSVIDGRTTHNGVRYKEIRVCEYDTPVMIPERLVSAIQNRPGQEQIIAEEPPTNPALVKEFYFPAACTFNRLIGSGQANLLTIGSSVLEDTLSIVASGQTDIALSGRIFRRLSVVTSGGSGVSARNVISQHCDLSSTGQSSIRDFTAVKHLEASSAGQSTMLAHIRKGCTSSRSRTGQSIMTVMAEY